MTFLKPPSRSPLFKTSDNSRQKTNTVTAKTFQTVPYIIGDIDLTENVTQRANS